MSRLDRYSFREAARLAEDFEALLKSKCIEVSSGGILEGLMLCTAEVEYLYPKLMSLDPITDIRSLFQQLIGIADILKKVLSVRDH